MKFQLTLLNDSSKPIRTFDFNTWYDDNGLKDEITKDGVDRLEQLAETIARSLQAEIGAAVKEVLFIAEKP